MSFRIPNYSSWHQRLAPISRDIQSSLKKNRKFTKPLPPMTVKQVKRFEELVDRSDGDDGCHHWLGTASDRGYGVLKIGPRGENVQAYAHRVSWMMANGRDPGDRYCAHLCHNPSCVNPRHIEAQTPSENTRAMHLVGRNPTSRGTGANLSGPQVREIRRRAANGVLQKDLAAIYKVTHQTIWSCVTRETYKDID